MNNLGAYASAEKADGSMVNVEGDLDTMIAGLACGELSEIGWPILARNVTGGYCKVADHIAGNGMRALAREAPEDRVEAGECGGAGAGLIMRLLEDREDSKEVRAKLGIDQFSTFLFVNTEGYTDPINCDKQLKMDDHPYEDGDVAFAPPLKYAVPKGSVSKGSN